MERSDNMAFETQMMIDIIFVFVVIAYDMGKFFKEVC